MLPVLTKSLINSPILNTKDISRSIIKGEDMYCLLVQPNGNNAIFIDAKGTEYLVTKDDLNRTFSYRNSLFQKREAPLYTVRRGITDKFTDIAKTVLERPDIIRKYKGWLCSYGVLGEDTEVSESVSYYKEDIMNIDDLSEEILVLDEAGPRRTRKASTPAPSTPSVISCKPVEDFYGEVRVFSTKKDGVVKVKNTGGASYKNAKVDKALIELRKKLREEGYTGKTIKDTSSNKHWVFINGDKKVDIDFKQKMDKGPDYSIYGTVTYTEGQVSESGDMDDSDDIIEAGPSSSRGPGGRKTGPGGSRGPGGSKGPGGSRGPGGGSKGPGARKTGPGRAYNESALDSYDEVEEGDFFRDPSGKVFVVAAVSTRHVALFDIRNSVKVVKVTELEDFTPVTSGRAYTDLSMKFDKVTTGNKFLNYSLRESVQVSDVEAGNKVDYMEVNESDLVGRAFEFPDGVFVVTDVIDDTVYMIGPDDDMYQISQDDFEDEVVKEIDEEVLD